MEQTPVAQTSSDVLVIFVGHSEDVSEEAREICALSSNLQKELDDRLEVMEPEPRFKKIKVWEWRDDAKPIVGGQDKAIAPHLKESHLAVFVFKERLAL